MFADIVEQWGAEQGGLSEQLDSTGATLAGKVGRFPLLALQVMESH